MSSRTPPSTPRSSLTAVPGLFLIENVSPGSGIGNLCTARLMFENTESRDAFSESLEEEKASISATTGHTMSIASSKGELVCNITLEGSNNYILLVGALSARFDIAHLLVEEDVEEENIPVEYQGKRGYVVVKTQKQGDGKFKMSIRGYIDSAFVLPQAQVFVVTQGQMMAVKNKKIEYFKEYVQSRLENDQGHRQGLLGGFGAFFESEEAKRIERLTDAQEQALAELGFNDLSSKNKILEVMNSGDGVTFEVALSSLLQQLFPEEEVINHEDSGASLT